MRPEQRRGELWYVFLHFLRRFHQILRKRSFCFQRIHIFNTIIQMRPFSSKFEEELLGVRSNLGTVTSNDQCLNLLPVLSIELKACIIKNKPNINLSCYSLVHLPLVLSLLLWETLIFKSFLIEFELYIISYLNDLGNRSKGLSLAKYSISPISIEGNYSKTGDCQNEGLLDIILIKNI